MYICLCNPFTDKELDSALQNETVRKRTSDVYAACTGGEKPCCGTCICEIKDRIETHKTAALRFLAE